MSLEGTETQFIDENKEGEEYNPNQHEELNEQGEEYSNQQEGEDYPIDSNENQENHEEYGEGEEEEYQGENKEENVNYNGGEEGNEEMGEGHVDPFVCWGKSIYAYEGNAEGELKFEIGQWIGILEDYGDGWSLGQVDGEGMQGNFPTDYLDYSPEAQQDEGYVTLRETREEEKNAASQKRKDERKQLMGEMKQIQEKVEAQSKLADSLQKEISDLGYLIQKERLQLNEAKTSGFGEESFTHDLLRLIYSMDHFAEVIHLLGGSEIKLHESFSTLANDVHKESKSKPALSSHASNLGMKIANHQGHTEALSKMLEDLVKSSFEVRPQLEVLVGFLTKENRKSVNAEVEPIQS